MIRSSILFGCLGAVLLLAQDWQTVTTLPGTEMTALTAAQKTRALKILRAQGCSCGCDMKVAECRIKDPSCAFSRGLARIVVESIGKGQSEAVAIAAANASHFAHPPTPKLLEDPVSIPIMDAPVTGPKDAAITLVEFSDFQCPFCIQAAGKLSAILKAYPTQVKLVFKQFPLDTHSQAAHAAAAAIAAHRQGKFWPMHDAMFADHDLSPKNILAIAGRVGLDMKRFTADLNSPEVQKVVAKDTADGDHAGVDSTPTLFIDGQHYNGSLEPDALKTVLDGELKRLAEKKK